MHNPKINIKGACYIWYDLNKKFPIKYSTTVISVFVCTIFKWEFLMWLLYWLQSNMAMPIKIEIVVGCYNRVRSHHYFCALYLTRSFNVTFVLNYNVICQCPIKIEIDVGWYNRVRGQHHFCDVCLMGSFSSD